MGPRRGSGDGVQRLVIKNVYFTSLYRDMMKIRRKLTTTREVMYTRILFHFFAINHQSFQKISLNKYVIYCLCAPHFVLVVLFMLCFYEIYLYFLTGINYICAGIPCARNCRWSAGYSCCIRNFAGDRKGRRSCYRKAIKSCCWKERSSFYSLHIDCLNNLPFKLGNESC